MELKTVPKPPLASYALGACGGLPVGAGEAVGVVFAWADADFERLAHQVVVMDALTALAGPDIGQNLGKAAMASGVDECCGLGMIFRPR